MGSLDLPAVAHDTVCTLACSRATFTAEKQQPLLRDFWGANTDSVSQGFKLQRSGP